MINHEHNVAAGDRPGASSATKAGPLPRAEKDGCHAYEHYMERHSTSSSYPSCRIPSGHVQPGDNTSQDVLFNVEATKQ
eukprot:763360-Hanusia_phi.AAC.5